MVYANDYICGSDSDTLQKAIDNRIADGIIVIGPRQAETEAYREY